ncbi:hypothetical protein SKAU_G00357570 [Synaphobranchus kaupii]|uniref:non-specific serine/threonine protein kinase n=1 Tax=Synaphobranchus kaupii TaxID=118154 RepID=A0A9Q1IGS2_SYNKA|nr:hypothetical protein SKAU_G00357570 [Synaphobranchus kaupii]
MTTNKGEGRWETGWISAEKTEGVAKRRAVEGAGVGYTSHPDEAFGHAPLLSALEIWRRVTHRRSQTAQLHTETSTRGEMTDNQLDADVTNKLMTADATANPLWPELPSEEQNVTPQEGGHSQRDDLRADTFCNAVESLLPFVDSLTESSLNDSDSVARQINGNGDVAQSQPGLSAPVAPTDLNRSCTGTQVVHLLQPKAETGSFASNDLWLHTDQVPEGVEDHAILGKQNKCSDVAGFAGSHKGSRQESGYSLEMVAAIGSPINDSWFRTPPVKTWPSTGSWAGERTNIVHIVLSSLDEPPAIVVQTLEIMAIKDREGKPPQAQGNTQTTEQMCLIPAGKDNNDLTAERGVEKVQTLLKIQAGDSEVLPSDCGDKGDRETPLTEEHSSEVTSEDAICSSLPGTVASQNLCESDMTDILLSPEYFTTTVVCGSAEDITPVRGRMPVGEEDLEICCEKIIPSQEEIPSVDEKLETDALWKVTEDPLSPLHVDIKERVERSRSNEPLTFSGYSGEPSAVKPVHGEELRPDTVTQRAAETFQGLACAPAQRGHQTQSYTTVRRKDKSLHVNLQGERNEGLDFIMPLAPNCQRNIRLNTDTHTTLKGDQQRAAFLRTDRNRTFDRSRAFPLENQTEELVDVGKGKIAFGDYPSGDHDEKLAVCSARSFDKGLFKPSLPGDKRQPLTLGKKSYDTVRNLSKEFSKLLIFTGDCEEDKTAFITLDLDNTVGCETWPGLENGNRVDYMSSFEHMKTNKTRCVCETKPEMGSKMPQKTARTSSGSKTSTSHKSKEKPASHQGKSKQPTSKKHDTPIPESPVTCESTTANTQCKATPVTDVETKEITEKCIKSRGKKKKKQSQHSSGKVEAETLKEAESSAKPKTAKGKTDALDASLAEQAGSNDKLSALTSQTNCLQIQKQSEVKNVTATVKGKGIAFDNSVCATDTKESQSTGLAKQQGEYVLKRRHLFEDKDGKRPIESKPQKSTLIVKKDEQAVPAEAGHRRAYSEVVKQKPQIHKEVPKVLQNIMAEKLSEDPTSISLGCQFSGVSLESSAVWTKEGAILEETKRRAGDEQLLSFTISNASSKDLGRYQCCLICPLGTVTSEFYLTSDVLSELLPSQDHHAAEAVEGAGEDVKCTPLLFKEDFLSEQYFGEKQPASIVTEQAHFGEGMHRRAFRTKLLGGMLPVFSPGHPCVLKVHNAISQGTKNNEDLIQKNYSLAVEECCVQNTAREYIKAYTTVAKSADDFGEVPEIIPILLVHRPSNHIPYATLEEELIGDFVKYSVKDGKEINLTRRDSEPGQKCCAFQHWVYNRTEGNLLITDMQGVGMKLTDVGIATPKKGYKGFRGNCATSFIDQFKALHQCNKFCGLLGLKPLQPSQTKPRRTLTAPNPKPQPQPKKKTFAFNLKSKS